MTPLGAPAATEARAAAARRLRLQAAARAVIGPLALALGCLQAAPALMGVTGVGTEDGLVGPIAAFLRSTNLVQQGLDLAAAALFILSGARLLGPRPLLAREEFTAGLVVEGALWVSFLRSPLYRMLLPLTLRAVILVALLSLLFAAVVLWSVFDGEPTGEIN